QLPLVRRRATTPILISRRDTTRLASCDLRGGAIRRSLRDRHQRLADLPCREPILPSARLTLPRLKAGRALHTERMRLSLTRQDRRESMLRFAVRRPAPPPLTAMSPLPVPPVPNHYRTGVLRDRTLGNLHYQATLSLQPDVSTQIE